MSANCAHVPCPSPGHRGSTDGFRLFNNWAKTGGGICNTCGGFGTGLKLLAFAKDIKMDEAANLIEGYLEQFPDVESDDIAVTVVTREKDPGQASAKMKKVWEESLPIHGTAAEKYLNNRGIWSEHIPTELRFHPGMQYWDLKERKSKGIFPVLLAPLKDFRKKVVGIHRIFITEDGRKAPVSDPKKPMEVPDTISGASIRLYDPVEDRDTELHVGEGIETMLAVHAWAQAPTWACYSARLLTQVVVPKFIKKVVIWADKDRSLTGQHAANTLAKRLIKEGFEVEVYYPKRMIPENEKGVDWLDVLITEGLDGVPTHYVRWKAK